MCVSTQNDTLGPRHHTWHILNLVVFRNVTHENVVIQALVDVHDRLREHVILDVFAHDYWSTPDGG